MNISGSGPIQFKTKQCFHWSSPLNNRQLFCQDPTSGTLFVCFVDNFLRDNSMVNSSASEVFLLCVIVILNWRKRTLKKTYKTTPHGSSTAGFSTSQNERESSRMRSKPEIHHNIQQKQEAAWPSKQNESWPQQIPLTEWGAGTKNRTLEVTSPRRKRNWTYNWQSLRGTLIFFVTSYRHF